MDNRFSRCLRLRTASDFKRVFQKAYRVNQKCLTAVCQRSDLPYPRLGLSISKKNVRKATSRNRIKRAVRESFRQSQQQLGGVDVVIIAYKSADSLTNTELRQCLIKLWQQLAKRYQSS